MTERELRPVRKTPAQRPDRRRRVHHHMTGESPRILILYYSGRGKAADLAATFRTALDQTASEKSP